MMMSPLQPKRVEAREKKAQTQTFEADSRLSRSLWKSSRAGALEARSWKKRKRRESLRKDSKSEETR